MTNITLSIPRELKEKLKEFPEINWSGLLRKYIESEVDKLIWKKEMLKRLKQEDESGFTQWSIEIGNKIKEGMWRRYKEEGW